MMSKSPEGPGPCWLYYFIVEAAGAANARVTAKGGKLLHGPHEVPGGMWASPLYIANGPGGKGAFIAVTTGNNVFALDETTGAIKWTFDTQTLGITPASVSVTPTIADLDGHLPKEVLFTARNLAEDVEGGHRPIEPVFASLQSARGCSSWHGPPRSPNQRRCRSSSAWLASPTSRPRRSPGRWRRASKRSVKVAQIS